MADYQTGLLNGFEPTDIELVRSMNLEQRVNRAIELLRKHEPPEGYWLADSFGKDSSACLRLTEMSGVKFEAWHSQTTIDPPELIRFGKKHHPNTKLLRPEMNMMVAVASLSKPPPTRVVRWCCELYKEQGGNGRVCIFGVRAAESKRRELKWREVTQHTRTKMPAICPIVFWEDGQLWEFIQAYDVPYCELYDQGFTRLGCIGCPLAGPEGQDREFAKWPLFERNWRNAIIRNWERWHNEPREDGQPRFQSRFKSGEELWDWWRKTRTPDIMREECQTGLLWTNQELDGFDDDCDVAPDFEHHWEVTSPIDTMEMCRYCHATRPCVAQVAQ